MISSKSSLNLIHCFYNSNNRNSNVQKINRNTQLSAILYIGLTYRNFTVYDSIFILQCLNKQIQKYQITCRNVIFAKITIPKTLCFLKISQWNQTYCSLYWLLQPSHLQMHKTNRRKSPGFFSTISALVITIPQSSLKIHLSAKQLIRAIGTNPAKNDLALASAIGKVLHQP